MSNRNKKRILNSNSRRKSISKISKTKKLVKREFYEFREHDETVKIVIFDNIVHRFKNNSRLEHNGIIVTDKNQKRWSEEYQEYGDEIPVDKFLGSWYVNKIFYGTDLMESQKLIDKFGTKFSYLNKYPYLYENQGNSLLLEINPKENIYLFMDSYEVYYFKSLNRIINFFPYVFGTAHITEPIAIDDKGNIYYLSTFYNFTNTYKSVYLYSEIPDTGFSSIDYVEYNKLIYSKNITEYFPTIKYLKLEDKNKSFVDKIFNFISKKVTKVKDVLDSLEIAKKDRTKKVIVFYNNGTENELTEDKSIEIYDTLKDKLAKLIPINVIKNLPKESEKIELEKLVKICMFSPWTSVKKINIEKLRDFLKDKKHLHKYLDKLTIKYKNYKLESGWYEEDL